MLSWMTLDFFVFKLTLVQVMAWCRIINESRSINQIIYVVKLSNMSNMFESVPLGIIRANTGPLQWRHNESDGVSNRRRLQCLLNCWFRRRSKKTSKLRVTGLCVGNSPVTGEFPAQKASDAENVSISWRHHAHFYDTIWLHHAGHDDLTCKFVWWVVHHNPPVFLFWSDIAV